MKGIDIAILSTHTEGKAIANRPMSNNGDVSMMARHTFSRVPREPNASLILNEMRSRAWLLNGRLLIHGRLSRRRAATYRDRATFQQPGGLT